MDEVLGGRARRYVHPRRCPTCPHELATAARAPRPHRRRGVLGSSLPSGRAPDASADQVDRGRLDRRCNHCCRFLAARWMGLVGDARAPGATGRVRLPLRRPLRADEHRHRDAASSPSRHRRPDQADPGVRPEGGTARRPLRIGDRRAADGPASLHAGGRARRGALDARGDRAFQPAAHSRPALRRPPLLPQPLRRDADARLARCPATRPGRPRRPPGRAAHRRPRHDAASARQPVAARARTVMAVAARPRILLRAADGADLASALGALGDVTTDVAPIADLVVFDATADRSFAELRRIVARDDDGAWRPVLVVAADDDLRIAALDAGADAVVGPRVESAELVARARALLRIKVRHDAVERQAAQFTDWTQSLVSRVAEQVEELQRVERLRRFLAPQVAQVVAHDEKLLESHRREIAAVFCDLRGFTAFSELAEPEEVMSVLREYHDALGALVFEYEATLERFAGDAILAFFNDPVPCPDPAARAVRMAVAMRERVKELVAGWRRRGYALDFGVGIALGYATLGRIGFAGRSDYGAVGTVVNLAARLCAEALGGQILLSERAHTLVEDLVEAEPLAPLRLKGFVRPVKALNVVALRAGQ